MCILKDQKNIHQNVNRGIMGDVYFFFLCGFLHLPKIIHTNIFYNRKKQLTFRKYCYTNIISNMSSIYEGKG